MQEKNIASRALHWPEGSSWCPEYLLIFAPSLRQFQPDLVPTSNLKRPTWQLWQLASMSELCALKKLSNMFSWIVSTFVLFQIYVCPDWDGHCTRGQFPAKTWTIPNDLPGFERHQHLHFFHSQNTKFEIGQIYEYTYHTLRIPMRTIQFSSLNRRISFKHGKQSSPNDFDKKVLWSNTKWMEPSIVLNFDFSL